MEQYPIQISKLCQKCKLISKIGQHKIKKYYKCKKLLTITNKCYQNVKPCQENQGNGKKCEKILKKVSKIREEHVRKCQSNQKTSKRN